MLEKYHTPRRAMLLLGCALGSLALPGCGKDAAIRFIDCQTQPGESIDQTFDSSLASELWGRPAVIVGDATMQDGEITWRTRVDVFNDGNGDITAIAGDTKVSTTRSALRKAGKNGIQPFVHPSGAVTTLAAPNTPDANEYAPVTVTFTCGAKQ